MERVLQLNPPSHNKLQTSMAVSALSTYPNHSHSCGSFPTPIPCSQAHHVSNDTSTHCAWTKSETSDYCSSELHFDYHKIIHTSCRTPNLCKNFFIQINSLHASVMAMYSALVVESATHFCNLDCYDAALFPK
jgi:hypothetical protein